MAADRDQPPRSRQHTDRRALSATARIVRLGPWDSGRRYLNLAESQMDPRSIFSAAGYDRLKLAKKRYDPANMFLANHPISPHEE
jgi:hypothetical protein